MNAVILAQRGHMIGTIRPFVKGAYPVVPKTKTRKEFATRLERLLDILGWDKRGRPARLERECGINRRTADANLRGDRAPRLDFLAKAAAGLGTGALLFLVTGTGVPSNEPRMPQDKRSPYGGTRGRGLVSAPLRVTEVPPPTSLELMQRIERAVGKAVERILARDELHKTRAGRSLLRRALRQLARDLNADAQMDVHELLDVIGELDEE